MKGKRVEDADAWGQAVSETNSGAEISVRAKGRGHAGGLLRELGPAP